MAEDFALYRYFDSTGRLLYAGRSADFGMRDTSHIARSLWMQLAVRSTIDHCHTTLADVKQAERHAIETEHPLFNRQFNDTPEAKERLRLYLDEIGRADLLSVPTKASTLKAGNLAPPEERPMPVFQPGDRVEIVKPGWRWTPVVTVHSSSWMTTAGHYDYHTDGCTDPRDLYIFQAEDLRLISRSTAA